MKEVIRHELSDFIPTSILDTTKAHYLSFWSITRTTEGEFSSSKNYSSKAAALGAMKAKWEKLNSSIHVKYLTPIHASGSETNEHFMFTYEFNGIDKEISICKEQIKIG